MWSSQQLACMVLHTCILFEAYLQTQAHFHTGCSVQLTGNFQFAKKTFFKTFGITARVHVHESIHCW